MLSYVKYSAVVILTDRCSISRGGVHAVGIRLLLLLLLLLCLLWVWARLLVFRVLLCETLTQLLKKQESRVILSRLALI